jgi:transcriptional regulator with XRE-family HTH domain
VTESTVTNWELNRTAPALRFLPRIITLLGFDPRPADLTLAQQLLTCRTARGFSREAAARLLGIDPGTLGRWESGERRPQRAFLTRVEAFLTGRPRSLLASGSSCPERD